MWPQSRPMSAPTTNATSLANLAPRPDRIGALGAARLPAITIEAADLPEDVLALLDHHLLDLGGTYGDPRTGDPIQSTTTYASSTTMACWRSSEPTP